MKKTDLKLDVEYAVSDEQYGGRYFRWNAMRAKVVSFDGVARDIYGRTTNGILIEFLDNGVYRYGPVKKGEQIALKSARNIAMPWEQYKPLFDKHNANLKAVSDERQRKIDVVDQTIKLMRSYGVPEEFIVTMRLNGNKTWKITTDRMLELVNHLTGDNQ
jgi:hypothetical protein